MRVAQVALEAASDHSDVRVVLYVKEVCVYLWVGGFPEVVVIHLSGCHPKRCQICPDHNRISNFKFAVRAVLCQDTFARGQIVILPSRSNIEIGLLVKVEEVDEISLS